MGVKASGSSLSFSEIENEFGQNNDRDLGEYRVSQTVGGLSNRPLDTGIPQSGEIKFSDFYSKKLNVIIDYHSGSTENRPSDARTKYQAGSASGNRTVIGGFKDRVVNNSSGSKVIIHVNKTIGSATGNVNNCAVRTGSFESGTDLTVDVGSSGQIFGAGGNGGNGSTSRTGAGNGQDGSSALGISYSGTVVNVASGGIIRQGYGGGGGGGGADGRQENSGKPFLSHRGSGGGGGAGLPGGEGGPVTGGNPAGAANVGADGGTNSAGSGGAAPSDYSHGKEGGFAGGGKGGDGGDAEQSAQNGNPGEAGGGEWESGPSTASGGTAGGNGAAIRRTSGITVTIGTNNGTITGSTTATGVS